MASVFNRGTRAKPRWYAKFRDAGGGSRTLLTHQTSRAEAMKVAMELQARAFREASGVEKREEDSPLAGPLIERWVSGDVVKPGEPRRWAGLTNRSARRDAGRARGHLIPRFGRMRLEEITTFTLIEWCDEMKAEGTLSGATQRHNLALLSRFFEWAVGRRLAQVNPVRSVPRKDRPRPTPKADDVPWLQDDAQVARIVRALPDPFGMMFYLGNRAGLRTGELCGLRMADTAFLAKGRILVSHSYAGPLKEDRMNGQRKVKKPPAPADWQLVIGPWLERRREQGAGPDDPAFCRPDGSMLDYEDVRDAWKRVRKAFGLKLTWYQATRHSFCSRNLARGAQLEVVSRAMGHSSPMVTQTSYNHFVQEDWPEELRAGLFVAATKTEADA
jgi:integrase